MLPLLAATMLVACNDDGGSTGGTTTSSSTTTGSTTTGSTTTGSTTSGSTTGSGTTTSTSSSPTITGSAPTTIVAGQAYSFQPSTTNPGGGALTFSISNKPAWASFNTATGLLSGTPTAAEVASYSSITISVSSGQASASLAPFAIIVTAAAAPDSASLAWDAPQENTNGSPLTDLAGYTIYYGTDSAELTQTIRITNPKQTTYVVSNLSPGTYYFSVAADASDGTQSSRSTLGSKTIL
jgi:hypothetical protein